MRICFCTDIHWARKSSIIDTQSIDFSTKLTGLINSLTWVNELGVNEKCDLMVCGGDFFDRTTIADDEATALNKIKWNNLPWKLLCGNHEASDQSLYYNLVNLLATDIREVIYEPKSVIFDDVQLNFLPYVAEQNKQPLSSYFVTDTTKKQIIVSHNDIAGVNYGGYTSQLGFSIKEIEENCDLFLNGHLHNSEWVSNKILNLGSLSAHNFTNDSQHYQYGAWILDTTSMKLTFFENPFSFNFYKLDLSTAKDLSILNNLKNNAVLSISCLNSQQKEIRNSLDMKKNTVVNYRLIIKANTNITKTEDISVLYVDPLQKFKEFIEAKLDISDTVSQELAQICK